MLSHLLKYFSKTLNVTWNTEGHHQQKEKTVPQWHHQKQDAIKGATERSNKY